MNNINKVSIIGSGNVASLLSKRIQRAGKDITHIYSKNYENAHRLATTINANACRNMSELALDTDLIIIAVSDDAIPIVSQELGFVSCPVVHTSGIVDMDILENNSESYGKLYPLQSITKHTSDHVVIPICICSNDADFESSLQTFTNRIFDKTIKVDKDNFPVIHLSAVLVNNFTNFLYAQAYNLMEDNNIEFDILKPLIEETVARLSHNLPQEMQTGPAKRNDIKTMQKHHSLLNEIGQEKLADLYLSMSDLIFKMK